MNITIGQYSKDWTKTQKADYFESALEQGRKCYKKKAIEQMAKLVEKAIPILAEATNRNTEKKYHSKGAYLAEIKSLLGEKLGKAKLDNSNEALTCITEVLRHHERKGAKVFGYKPSKRPRLFLAKDFKFTSVSKEVREIINSDDFDLSNF